jgi:uncharacterized protein (TIGR01777 family)
MRIVIAGGTGFLGRALLDSLGRDGHALTVLSRSAAGAGSPRIAAWSPDGSAGPWAAAIDGADAVVNLAGESIAGRRWNAAQKQRILDSRVLATRSLVTAINQAAKPPSVFVSGSAVGYYGPLGDEIATEEHAAGSDFLADVCRQWEAEAAGVKAPSTRVAMIRTGLVLERGGGALAKMLPPFWFGAGGPIGSGRQYWPWIHLDDWVGLVRWTIAAPAASGAFNATAPNPMTNAAFAKALGRAVHRPAFMPAPAFAMRAVLGEMADALLLSGQRAIPERALRGGYRFKYEQLDDALRAIF